ncbi:MAG: exopolyphosphatase [Pseudomonadota bacterium]
MVVFEGGRRCPAMVFNEKVLCGLGSDLQSTGRLAPEGTARALHALKRFVALAPGLKIGSLAGVATAAVRDAEDGQDFCARVFEETGIRLDVASGEDEARLAAQGVLFGVPKAHGLVVDLGGASMELCPIRNGRSGAGVSTPLGPLRLQYAPLAGLAAKAELMRYQERYAETARRLYLVGGSWRALGRVAIERNNHPMSVLHEYRFDRESALDVARFLTTSDDEEIGKLSGVSSGRVKHLPMAGMLLETLLDVFQTEDVVISGFGLREGVCFEYLPLAIKREDPLISTCLGQETTRARMPGFGKELGRWIIDAIGPQDSDEDRLIRAACHLVDVSWRAHPDYRARSCIEVVTRVNVSGAGHRARAYMGAMLLNRYKGGRKAMAAEPAMGLLTDERKDRASAIGALMRLGCTISGATPGYLRRMPLSLDKDHLTLTLRGDAEVVMGEEIEKRLGQAARAFGVDPKVAT